MALNLSKNRLRTFWVDGRSNLGRLDEQTPILRKTYMCSICLPQSGQALRLTCARHISRCAQRKLASKSLHSRCQSARRTPQYRTAKLVIQVSSAHIAGIQHYRNGGARRDRTDDLKLAKLPLSQLSYGPVSPTRRSDPPGPAPIWWAWEDSNFRPHAYQARALTN